jgi:hypothetical protein
MTDNISPDDFPEGYHAGKYIRGGLQVAGADHCRDYGST